MSDYNGVVDLTWELDRVQKEYKKLQDENNTLKNDNAEWKARWFALKTMCTCKKLNWVVELMNYSEKPCTKTLKEIIEEFAKAVKPQK